MTPASSKPWAGAACSTSCAPPAGCTNWPASTASPSAWEAAASLQLRSRRPERARRLRGPRPDRRRHRSTTTSSASPTTGSATPPTGRTVAITAATNDHVDAINDAVQAAPTRQSASSTPTAPSRSPAASTPIPATSSPPAATTGSLRTSTGEPVRNRDLWDVVGDPPGRVAHRVPPRPDTAPSPSRPTTPGSMCVSATPPPSTATRPTPSTSPSSSSPTATTHRGLYVGATRGRDENRIHVITDTDDLAEARDVLESRPRPRPGRHPRRHPATRPRPTRAPDPPIPDDPSRRRSFPTGSARGGPSSSSNVRTSSTTSTTEPAVAPRPPPSSPTSSRHSPPPGPPGSPTRDAIAEIEDELRSELRPAMWKANHDAMHAGFGHHHAHGTASQGGQRASRRRRSPHRRHPRRRRRRQTATRRASKPQAWNLHDLAHPSPAGFGLEAFTGTNSTRSNGLLDAVDIWTTWAHGRPVSTDRACRRRRNPHRRCPAAHRCAPSTVVRSTAPNRSTRSSQSPSCSKATASNCLPDDTTNSNETAPSSASTFDSLGYDRPIRSMMQAP